MRTGHGVLLSNFYPLFNITNKLKMFHRLSQINTQRLQGIVTDSEPTSPKYDKKESKPKLVPTAGGYFQEKDGKKRTK
jgi:hypothetical protein